MSELRLHLDSLKCSWWRILLPDESGFEVVNYLLFCIWLTFSLLFTYIYDNLLLNIYIGAFEINAIGANSAQKFLYLRSVQVFLHHINPFLEPSEIACFKVYFDLPWPSVQVSQNNVFEIIPVWTRLYLFFWGGGEGGWDQSCFLRTACSRICWVTHLLTSQSVRPVIIAKNGGELKR